MGAIGGMLGLGGGAAGTGFDKPQNANLAIGTDVTQVGDAYSRAQHGLTQQQLLMEALQKQGGLQNQSNVFNQLQGVANGTGPNPAQAMLNQQTGANVANQAALMAGQRGAGANVGLMARQAAQQGANTQQQAVGQGATMQANQSLNALNQMGGIANTQAANQIGATGAYNSAAQSEQGNLLNALQGLNANNVASQGSVNSANASLAQQGMKGQQSLVGGIGNAIGGAAHIASGGLFNNGGMVPGYAAGGGVGPQSSFGQFVTTVNAPSAPAVQQTQFDSSGPEKPMFNFPKQKASPPPGTDNGGYPKAPGGQARVGGFTPEASGGMVDVVLSPGEKVVSPEKVDEAADGKVEAKTVPGKAKVDGDSLKNDTYKTKLPAGSVVVPRTKSKDKRDSAEFVRKTLAKRRRK